MMHKPLPIFFLLTILLSFTLATPSQEDIRCLTCHGKPGFSKTDVSGRVVNLFVDPHEIRLSLHKNHICVDCHADVGEVPHPQTPGKVDCRRCHYEGNAAGAPETSKYVEYEESVHGQAILAGNAKAPACQDCHGGHFILPAEDERSTLNHRNIPHVCGTCHLGIFVQYQNSVHGKALEEGVKDAPVCTDCHGEHTIQRPEVEASSVSAGHVSDTCSKCHASVAIMEKYGVKAEQVATYDDSFHGIANEFGVLKAANCASCHTAHEILPESDPASSVHPDNIPKTCGKCHPSANTNFAKGRIHMNPKDKSSGIVYWVALGFEILTISTLIGLFIHILLDLYRKFKSRRRKRDLEETEADH